MRNIFLTLLSLLVFYSCDEASGGLEASDSGNGLDVRKAVEITSGDSSIRGELGSKIQLEYKEININAGASGYVWSSSDENVITVNQNGVATGVNFGTANITLVNNNDSTIKDEIIVGVKNAETYYSVSKNQNVTTTNPVGGIFNSSVANPALTEVFNSANVLKFERTESRFSFLRFTASKKIDFGNPDNTITFWAYVVDAGNNGLVVPNNQMRVIARNAAGNGAQQAATSVQEIPEFNKWIEYSFDMTDVLVSGTDYFQINIFFAPADTKNQSEGTIYYIDNVRGPFLQ